MLADAISALKAGRFVLVHDDKGREDEIDMVIAAEHVKPEHIAAMRQDAGGLICLAIPGEVAAKLGLVYMHDMISDMGKVNTLYSKLTEGKAAYGDKPSFSISVNHRQTFTGITDSDRALTVSRLAQVCRNIESSGVDEFARDFRAPGHIPILIASKRLLTERSGHTELCVYLTKLAGITPAVVMCEMMDGQTYKALSIEKARDYAERSGVSLIEASELKEEYQKANIA